MNDDFPVEESLYPRDGADYGVGPDTANYYDQPQEQAEAERKVQATQQASFPIMADIVDWFDTAIDGLDSRQAILDYAKHSGISKDLAGEAFDVARNLLQAKLMEFEDYRRER